MTVPRFLDLGIPSLTEMLFSEEEEENEWTLGGLPWGSVVVVDGAAGVGKTRFAEHVATRVAEFSRVAWVSPHDAGREPSRNVDFFCEREVGRVSYLIRERLQEHSLVVLEDLHLSEAPQPGLNGRAVAISSLLSSIQPHLKARVLLATWGSPATMPKALKFYAHLRLSLRREGGDHIVKVLKSTLSAKQGHEAPINLADLQPLRPVKPEPDRRRSRFDREDPI